MRRIVIILALLTVGVVIALAGSYHYFSYCNEHIYPPGTTVNGCGDYYAGCPGTCGFTQSDLYYYTCEWAAFRGCQDLPPINLLINMDTGYCYGSGSSPFVCLCGSAGGTMQGYIQLTQCQ